MTTIILIVLAVLVFHFGEIVYRKGLQAIQAKKNKAKAVQTGAQSFDHHYIDTRHFYVSIFKKMPSICVMHDVDPAKAFQYINETCASQLVQTYQRNTYNWEEGRQEFSRTIFQMNTCLVIEVGISYVEFLYDLQQSQQVEDMMSVLAGCKVDVKAQDFEINIITQTVSGLELKALPIQPTKLDVALYYNDDFEAVDALIQQRLGNENDKGIILLHGLPGTGKTTYLRYLIGSLKKKVLFVSPAVAANLMNPEFIDLLMDNPNSILVIEDAENIIMDRKLNGNSSVSNLLNISDGLLSDCLNVQLVCTFNSALSLIDSALLRKGRLIACYEFGKLSVQKAQALANHLELKRNITVPMTLAEITHADEPVFETIKQPVFGFRREILKEACLG
jgi:hypothetical protein